MRIEPNPLSLGKRESGRPRKRAPVPLPSIRTALSPPSHGGRVTPIQKGFFVPMKTARTSFAEHRHSLNITQEDLARRAGCSVAYVRFLDGGFMPDPERSPAYVRVLRVLHEAEEQGR